MGGKTETEDARIALMKVDVFWNARMIICEIHRAEEKKRNLVKRKKNVKCVRAKMTRVLCMLFSRNETKSIQLVPALLL